MYASISSVDDERYSGPFTGIDPSRGPTVDTSQIRILPSVNELSIHAEVHENFGTGNRGGQVKTIRRKLVINIDPENLQRIVDAAIQAKLVTVPESPKLAEAAKHLKLALATLSEA